MKQGRSVFFSICLLAHSALLFWLLWIFRSKVSIADVGHAGGPRCICLGVGFVYSGDDWRFLGLKSSL